MGKVNSLYQQEREDKLNALVKQFRADGYSREAEDDMRQMDEANGQFGVGA